MRKPQLPDVHFGEPGVALPDWRRDAKDEADDDAEGKTPADVVEMLGFDPAEEEDDA